jgi:hypothetical protein
LLGDVEGREVLLDSRIQQAMPRQLPITRRGIGRLRHLALNFSGDEWAELLYPAVKRFNDVESLLTELDEGE